MKTKNIFSIALLAIIALTTMAFTPSKSKKVKPSESSISWKAYKITGASHEGTITLKEGNLEFDGKTLTGGNFVVDMTTINNTDMSGDGKKSLEGHLKSDDFFGVKNHPTARFEIKKIKGNGNEYKVIGDLTIKGITKSISFIMTVKNNTATATLKVNRTLYDIKYGSASFFDGLKDKAINDEFDLNVSLKY
jgi:polyisoprenoid-binding protein YceI